jgi:hypothetical protein
MTSHIDNISVQLHAWIVSPGSWIENLLDNDRLSVGAGRRYLGYSFQTTWIFQQS